METIPGKFCPVCKFKNDANAITCAYCGASLEIVHKGKTTTKHVEENETKLFSPTRAEINAKDLAAPKKGLSIYLTSGILVETVEAREFFLGRKSEETETTMVDMTPFGAYQVGVSRKHALIRQTRQGYYEIIDQGSTNGTFLNGERLAASQAYPLPTYAQVSLGRLHLLVIYTKPGLRIKLPKR